MTPAIVAKRPTTVPEACAELLRHGSMVVTTQAAAGDPWVRTSVMFDGDVITTLSPDFLDSVIGPKLVETHTSELRALTTMVTGGLSRVARYVVDGTTVAGVAATIAELLHARVAPLLAIVVGSIAVVPMRFALSRVARWWVRRQFRAAVSSQK